MTEQGFSELAGKKAGSLLPTLSLSKHYTSSLPQTYPISVKNPYPISSRANLNTLKTPDSVFPKTGFAKMGHASQSLIKRNSRALFKGKSERVRVLGGDSESLPHLMRRGFERDQATLPIASEIGVKIPLKDSDSEGLMGMDINQGVERRKPQECSVDESWEFRKVEKPMPICICNNGLWNNHKSANIIEKRECCIDEALRHRGVEKGIG